MKEEGAYTWALGVAREWTGGPAPSSAKKALCGTRWPQRRCVSGMRAAQPCPGAFASRLTKTPFCWSPVCPSGPKDRDLRAKATSFGGCTQGNAAISRGMEKGRGLPRDRVRPHRGRRLLVSFTISGPDPSAVAPGPRRRHEGHSQTEKQRHEVKRPHGRLFQPQGEPLRSGGYGGPLSTRGRTSRGSPSGVRRRPGAVDELQRVGGAWGHRRLRTKGREAEEGAEWKAGGD